MSILNVASTSGTAGSVPSGLEAQRLQEPGGAGRQPRRAQVPRLGEARGEHHAHGDRLTVGTALERLEAFEGMPQRVAVVEDEARSLVALVARHGPGLRADATSHERLQRLGLAPENGRRVALELFQQFHIERQRVLGHLGESGPEIGDRRACSARPHRRAP